MRRWNGWGDDGVSYPLPNAARRYLVGKVGPGTGPRDARLEEALRGAPEGRLPRHSLVNTDPLERLRHARGQSLPDWIALRSGRIGAYPDGVAYPADEEQVRGLLRYAADAGARVIPYGGGTSVVGHINPLPGDAPVLTVDLARLNGLQRLDEASRLATFEAGVAGPDLEAQLRARGYTLGHFPQSFEYSTLGGWIATRSSGQQSLGYGRIEKLFAGGRLIAPAGTLDLPPFPASAAGTELRELALGSEGRLGILTEATVRVSCLPESEAFHGVFLSDWETALAAVRTLMQAGLPLSMARLSTPEETRTTLALAGHTRLIGALEQFLSARGAGDDKCMLILGFTGRERIVNAARKEALGITKKHGGIHVRRTFGNQWRKSRFRTPYLRNTLWEMGYAIDTIETAASWSDVPGLADGVDAALRGGLADVGERVHVFTHLSHVYPYGSSVYTTYLYRAAPDPEETLRRWRTLKDAASREIQARGGTISHQHGVGTDHMAYLEREKGELGMGVMGDICRRFDPGGMMNPGKLIA